MEMTHAQRRDFNRHTKIRCPECRRLFNLLNEQESAEWYSGHDCESEE